MYNKFCKYNIDFNSFLVQLSIFIFFFIVSSLNYNQAFIGGDVGEYINNTYRILLSEKPYLDFWLLYPPGEVYFPALLTHFFGFNLDVFFFLYITICSLIGLASFRVGVIIFNGNKIWAILLALLIFGNSYIRFGSANYIPVHQLFIFLSFDFFFKFLKTQKNNYLFVTGILIGISFLFRIYLTGAIFCSILLVQIYPVVFLRKEFNFSGLISYIKGLLLIVCLTGIVFSNNLFLIFNEVFIESVQHASKMNIPYFQKLISYFNHHITAIQDTLNIINYQTVFIACVKSLNLIVLLVYITPLILPLIAIYYLKKKPLSTIQIQIILTFLFSGLLSFPKALGRSDILHVFPTNLYFLFILAYLSYLSLELKTEYSTKFENILKKVLVTIFSLFLLSNIKIIANQTQRWIKSKQEVITTAGSYFPMNLQEANELKQLIELINQKTKEGDYIFITPWDPPPLYALTKRRNPTYYDSLIDPVVRPNIRVQEKICKDILSKKTKLIIHQNNFVFDKRKDLKFNINCRIINTCIKENFEIISRIGTYHIYLPKS